MVPFDHPSVVSEELFRVPAVCAMPHQAHGNHEPIAADLGNQLKRWIDAQTQQLKAAPLRQDLLKLPGARHYFLWLAGIAQQLQQQRNSLRHGRERTGPWVEVGRAPGRRLLLPGVVRR